MENIYKQAIEYLPKFFDAQLELDSTGACVFNPLKAVIDFDEAYIFFLSPDNINLRYVFNEESKFNLGKTFSIDDELKNKLFSENNVILDRTSQLINRLQFDNCQSYLIIKLIIKNTVFGFVLLGKNEPDFYSKEALTVSKALGSVISYKIKDLEMSNVFKMQVQALRDNVVQMKEQNVKILEADKIKNDFLANVSHELRTPLNSIIGFSEMLSTKHFGDLTEKQEEYVNDIHVSGIHLLGFINEILDISKLEAHAMELYKTEFLLSLPINEVVNIVKPLASKKKVKIEKNVTEFEVLADFQKIRQILYNLLSNAIKFSPENGTIYVNAYQKSNHLFFEVKDEGIGIAQEDKDRIFEKFVQLDNTYTKKESSTGLGLTITKEFVEMHKGKIYVESEQGSGATFIVKLPLSK